MAWAWPDLDRHLVAWPWPDLDNLLVGLESEFDHTQLPGLVIVHDRGRARKLLVPNGNSHWSLGLRLVAFDCLGAGWLEQAERHCWERLPAMGLAQSVDRLGAKKMTRQVERSATLVPPEDLAHELPVVDHVERLQWAAAGTR